jgi:glycosyltransferase involved in cell wall biosynthesis
MVRFIYKGCDRILVPSRAFSPPIVERGVDPRRISYFPNNADALYKPVVLEHDASEKNQMPEGFRVMFAGNIGAAQDFETLLKAAGILKNKKDIHWVIIGDGRMRPWVEKQVREQKLTKTVHLLGRHPANSMPRYFSLADVLLVTLRKEEIFALTIPSKVQAYLACAKPILAALDGEGERVIRESGAGLAVPAEAPEKLAAAVMAVYNMNSSDRLKMGARGRTFFEKNFDRSILLDRLEGWIKELN